MGAGSRRRRRAPRDPAREEEREPVREIVLLAAPALGTRAADPPCLALPSSPARTGRCPRCRQRGLSSAERGVCAGRAAPSAGARVMGRCWGRLGDPECGHYRILLSLCFRFRSGCWGWRASRRLDAVSELGFPAGDGLTGGRVGERGAHWQLSPPETKGCRVEPRVKDSTEDLRPLKVDTSSLTQWRAPRGPLQRTEGGARLDGSWRARS